MPNSSFIRWAGVALTAGGALTVVVNAVFTPFLPHDVPFEQTAASLVFLWRQAASALAAALLLLGSVGLYLRQSRKAGYFAAIAFMLAFLGSALLLAVEWNEVFLVRDLALRQPAALKAMDSGKHPSLYDLGAMIPLGVFTLGWIALAASTIRNLKPYRRAASLVIAGFFVIPLLSAAISGLWGAILGNLVLGGGWFWLGNVLRRDAVEEFL